MLCLYVCYTAREAPAGTRGRLDTQELPSPRVLPLEVTAAAAGRQREKEGGGGGSPLRAPGTSQSAGNLAEAGPESPRVAFPSTHGRCAAGQATALSGGCEGPAESDGAFPQEALARRAAAGERRAGVK